MLLLVDLVTFTLSLSKGGFLEQARVVAIAPFWPLRHYGRGMYIFIGGRKVF
jgi:hypothetical protein